VGRIVKKTIILLIISLILILIGILYGENEQPIQKETVLLKQSFNPQLPENKLDVVLDPMVGFPVH